MPIPSPLSATDAPAPSLAAGRPWLGWTLCLVVAATLGLVLWQPLVGPAAEDAPPVRWQRSLHFEDRANGDIGVVDAGSGQEVARFSGEQGFVRGALRALVRERVRRGLGPEQPFALIGHTDGRLTLHDPATGTRIALESFGPSNAAVFARLRQATAADTPPPRPQGAKS